MNKVFLGALGAVMILFAVVMIVLFLNEYSVVLLSGNLKELLEGFQSVFTLVVVIFALVLWVCAFSKDGVAKYNIHDIAGIIGIGMFLAAFAGVIFGLSLSYLFVIGGFFCVYCVLVPLVKLFTEKFSNNKWEPALVWAVLASISLYVMSTFSDIIINEIFGVDAKFFSQTKPIAMLLVATPVTALISFVCLLISIIPIFRKSGKVDFYWLNGFVASYAVLVSSLAYGGNISAVLEKTATFADFNSNHPCKLDETVKGVVFLDPTFQNVLVYDPSSETKYKVKTCSLKY